MRGHVDDGGGVGGGFPVHVEAVVVVEAVGDGHGSVAGIAFFAIGREIRELQRGAGGVAVGFAGPYAAVEAHEAAVHVAAGGAAGGQIIGLAVDLEPRAGDAAGGAAEEGAEPGIEAGMVGLEGVVPYAHVVQAALAVGDAQGLDAAAEFEELGHHAVGVGQTEQVDRFTVEFTKNASFNSLHDNLQSSYVRDEERSGSTVGTPLVFFFLQILCQRAQAQCMAAEEGPCARYREKAGLLKWFGYALGKDFRRRNGL